MIPISHIPDFLNAMKVDPLWKVEIPRDCLYNAMQSASLQSHSICTCMKSNTHYLITSLMNLQTSNPSILTFLIQLSDKCLNPSLNLNRGCGGVAIGWRTSLRARDQSSAPSPRGSLWNSIVEVHSLINASLSSLSSIQVLAIPTAWLETSL